MDLTHLSPSEMLSLLVNTGGLIIAATALALTAANSSVTRKNVEITTLFEIWRQYERYSEEAGREGTSNQQQARYLNLLNYVENISQVFNERRADKMVLDNIKTVVSDFVTGANTRIDLAAVIHAYAQQADPHSFCEIKKFCRDNKDLLFRKAARAKGSVYEALNRSSD